MDRRPARAPGGLGVKRPGALLAGACLAGMLAAGPAWCAWQTFGLADGLVALQIRAIAEDPSENLWFASGQGVSCYDGAFFRNLGVGSGLASPDVRAVLADRSGRIWFGTGAGVSRLDHGTWTTFSQADGLASDDVRAILEDRGGSLWFATSLGVSRFDGSGWIGYDQSDGLTADQVSCLFEDDAGNLWFGTDQGGLSRFDGASWTTYTTVTTGGGLANDAIRCILETRDGALWVGTRYGGLCRFDGSSWTTFTTVGTLTLSDVTALSEDAAGTLWVGSDTGVARFDGRSWRSYTTSDGLVGNMVLALVLDRNGNRWIGTQSGVSRYDGESWTPHLDAGLGAWGAQTLLEDATGTVWAGTAGAGVARYDRTAWTSVTVASTGGGLAGNNVAALAEDSTGALWFGTTAGASRLAGGVWQTLTTADGLAGNNVAALARDSSGALWLGTTLGLSRFDGSVWTSYTTSNGLPANRVRSLRVDRSGRTWCGTTAGVSVFESGVWTTYSTADGLAGNNVYAILEDHAGAMWFGTPTGLSRFVGGSWQTYRMAQGLAADWVLSLSETPDSVLWVGTAGGGVSRFDGALWHTYTTQDGLPDGTVSAAMVERSRNLWFGTISGAVLYEPARVPPQTVITSPAPPLSANTLQTIQFAAGFRQVLGIEFSTSLDSAPWSPWTTDVAWVGRDLPDGVHRLRVAARDRLHHVDSTPATCTFEVAATPPAPVITTPVFRQPVRDTLVVTGTAEALRFRSLRVDLRPAEATSWDPPDAMMLAQSDAPVVNGPLASLGTRSLPDGDYELRLSVQDTLGLTGFARVTFIVDNVAPFAAQTTPALVSALDGGEVYTTNNEAHLRIPPRGLPRDATVRLDPLDPAQVPLALPDGATRVASGFAIGTEGLPLEKTATLDLAVPAGATMPGRRLAIYAGSSGVWQRLGGTLGGSGTRLSTPISGPGDYAVYDAPAEAEVASPFQLSITPRVFSSRGAFASTTIQIGFVLARAATVRVTVHNRARRLVRIVTSGQSLGPGTNLVSWDGRDEQRRDVESGLYLVTVEALGQTHTQTLVVVR